jgi:hypothetical protein
MSSISSFEPPAYRELPVILTSEQKQAMREPFAIDGIKFAKPETQRVSLYAAMQFRMIGVHAA